MMGSETPEIITLQIGHYANFVGTHWWNIQESSFVYDPSAQVELDHAVLFREGETSKREVTFTPRLLAVDLRGSLGHLRRRGQLYSEPAPAEPDRLWQGHTVRHKQETRAPTSLRRRLDRLDGATDDDDKDVCQGKREEDESDGTQEEDDTTPAAAVLDGEVRVWSDFLGTHLNPWTVHILSEHIHENTNDPFDVFGFGESQYLREDFRDDFEDRLRAYAEECDHLVGFHVLADECDGFGGVSAGALAHLSDEYPGRSALVAPLQPPPAGALSLPQAVHQAVNTVLTLDAAARHASLCTPLSVQAEWTAPLVAPSYRRMENFEYKPELPYHSGAVLAAALDTITLPWRRKRDPVPLYEVTSSLSYGGRTVAGVASSLPLGIGQNDYLSTWLEGGNLKLCSVTPGVGAVPDESEIWSSCTVLRGVPDKQLRPAGVGSDPWLEVTGRRAAVRLREPLRTASPFPALFGPTVGRDGLLQPRCTKKDGVRAAPTAAALQSSRAVGDSLAALHAVTARFNIAKFHRFSAGGLETDDWAEVLERTSDLVRCYRPREEV
ncbi:protein misato homolog 1-like isoform X2 [Pollicipes pollicipes]|nr:protein misato homolog 1-like isoform X2 [Pollicipes pollicipes]XP_037080390.1 protein misato homolog 1-like isoform X2 [Pollicipes pollicipes]